MEKKCILTGTGEMMKYKIIFLGYLVFLSVPVRGAFDGAVAGHSLVAPIDGDDSGNATFYDQDGDDHTGDDFDGLYLDYDDYTGHKENPFPSIVYKDNPNYAGDRPGGIRLPPQATIDTVPGDGATSTAVHHVTNALGQVAALADASAPVLSDDLRESQVQLKKLIATAAEAAQKLLTFPEGSKNILLAMRVLEILKTLENHTGMQNGAVLETVGLTQEFAQVKLLLDNAINNKRIALALKIQDLYGNYAAKGDQKNVPFSKTFKDKVSALFVDVPSQFQVQGKNNAETKEFLSFQKTIRDLLESPMTPQVRANFRAAVYTELTSGFGKEGDFKSRIEALQSVDPVFKNVFEAMDAQDAALEKQLSSMRGKSKSGQEPEPASKLAPEGTYELFKAFQGALRSAEILKGSLMPEASEAFKDRIALLPAKKEQLEKFSKSAHIIAEALKKMVDLRDEIDPNGEDYQQADLQVKKLSIALKTIIEMYTNLKNEIENDQRVILDALSKLQQFAQDHVADLPAALLRSLGTIPSQVGQEVTRITRALADEAGDQLAGLKKQLITQQATDFVYDTQLMQEMGRVSRSFEGLSGEVIDEGLGIRNFSLQEAIEILDEGPVKKKIRQIIAFEERVEKGLEGSRVDLATLQQTFEALVEKKGTFQQTSNRQIAFVRKVLKALPYPEVTQSFEELVRNFNAAVARVDSLKGRFAGSMDDEIEKMILSFSHDASEGEYDTQNELFGALRDIQFYQRQIAKMVKTCFATTFPSDTHENQIVQYLDAFNGRTASGKNDQDEAVRDEIRKMITPAYVQDAPFPDEQTRENVQNNIHLALGRMLLRIPLSSERMSTNDLVSSEDAALIKDRAEKLLAQWGYDDTGVEDWRIIPEAVLRKLGAEWLARVPTDKQGNLTTFADKQMLVDAWAEALRNTEKGMGLLRDEDRDQPFRNIAVIVLGTPLDEALFFSEKQPSSKSLERLQEEGTGLTELQLGQEESLTDALTTYKTFLAANVGQARAAFSYLQTITDRVATFGQEGGLTLEELPFMISDIGSFQQALGMGEKSSWQQDLMDRSTAVKEALSRLVTAYTVTVSTVLDGQLLSDLKARLARINQLLLFSPKTLTASDVSELRQWASIEPLEKALLKVLAPEDKEEIISEFDRFDEMARDQLLPAFEEVSLSQKENPVFSKNKK